MAQTSAKTLANLFGLTESRIHQLVKEGLPKENRGQYDLLKCVRWYIRFLQNAIEKKIIPTGAAYVGERGERIRQIRASTELKELSLAEKRSQLVAIQDAERAFADLRRDTTAHVMTIPARLAPDLVGETSRVMIQARIDKACKETLGYLAKMGKSGIGGERA